VDQKRVPVKSTDETGFQGENLAVASPTMAKGPDEPGERHRRADAVSCEASVCKGDAARVTEKPGNGSLGMILALRDLREVIVFIRFNYANMKFFHDSNAIKCLIRYDLSASSGFL
jgi:hypothetical protein